MVEAHVGRPVSRSLCPRGSRGDRRGVVGLAGVREHRGVAFIGAGVAALGA